MTVIPDAAVQLLGDCAALICDFASARVITSRGESDDALVVDMIKMLSTTLTALLQQGSGPRGRLRGGKLLGTCEHLASAQSALLSVFRKDEVEAEREEGDSDLDSEE
jgi:hypothetical protein